VAGKRGRRNFHFPSSETQGPLLPWREPNTVRCCLFITWQKCNNKNPFTNHSHMHPESCWRLPSTRGGDVHVSLLQMRKQRLTCFCGCGCNFRGLRRVHPGRGRRAQEVRGGTEGDGQLGPSCPPGNSCVLFRLKQFLRKWDVFPTQNMLC
jgi:hypothetical protein